MKKILTLLLAVSFMYACSKDDKSEKSVKSEDSDLTVNVEPGVITEVESTTVTSTYAIDKNESSASMELKRILSKRINPETFESDIAIIEQSGFYDSSICESLRRSYKISKNYAANSWSMTYRQALDASREGVEKAKKIERITTNNL